MPADTAGFALAFGFVNPSKEDFGTLGREVLRRATREANDRQSRARLLVLPGLLIYLLFAFGVGAVLWALNIELPTSPFLAVVTVSFLLMAALGRYYKDQPSWTMVAGGIGRSHSVLLIQAYLIKALTAAFFILPYRVLTTIADLFPRRPKVDHRVLTVAVHLLAALDEPVKVEALARTLPRGVGREVLEEAVILLDWAGAAHARARGDHHLAVPGRARDTLLAGLADSQVVTVSDLRRPRD